MNHSQPPHDLLDNLMARRPPPPAPAWFAARTMARIREEKARQPWWRNLSHLWQRPPVWAGAALLVLLAIGWGLLFFESSWNSPASMSMAEAQSPVPDSHHQTHLFAAFEAFESLTEEDLLLWTDFLGSL